LEQKVDDIILPLVDSDGKTPFFCRNCRHHRFRIVNNLQTQTQGYDFVIVCDKCGDRYDARHKAKEEGGMKIDA
jgi:transcription elongation factor Elf1